MSLVDWICVWILRRAIKWMVVQGPCIYRLREHLFDICNAMHEEFTEQNNMTTACALTDALDEAIQESNLDLSRGALAVIAESRATQHRKHCIE